MEDGDNCREIEGKGWKMLITIERLRVKGER